MEEGGHRCGEASGDTSHYGVNCTGGGVVWRAGTSHTHTHTHGGNQENIWIRATCLEEVIYFTHCTGGPGGAERAASPPSWMCNLHASLRRWERMEDGADERASPNDKLGLGLSV